MQKLLRRTAQAKAHASRRTKNEAAKARTENRKIRQYQYTIANRAVLQDVKAAQVARREDHLLGPLAPRRDVGSKRDTYGTVDEKRVRGPGIKGIAVEKGGKPEAWTGIKEGDRVVVVGKGVRDWGKVGVVKEVRANQGKCAVEGVNLVDVETPGATIAEDNPRRPFHTVPALIPLSAVRLIYPLPPPHDPTATPIDTLIPALKRIAGRPGRYIAHADPPIRIPWPRKEKPVYEDHDIDTLRIDVEEETWIPTLLRAPMPGTVIDELRNKYSAFRSRHEESYVAMHERADARNARREERRSLGMGGMMTPLRELHVKQRREREWGKRREEGISEEVLGRIGEVMARNGVSIGEERVEA